MTIRRWIIQAFFFPEINESIPGKQEGWVLGRPDSGLYVEKALHCDA